MKNSKTTIYCLIAIAIMTLLITSSVGLQVQQNGDSRSIKIKKSNSEPQYFSIQGKNLEMPYKSVKTIGKGTNFVFEGLHPAFGRNNIGTIMAAYYDTDLDNINWTFSTNDGATFDDGVYYPIGGDYPSIKLWEGQRFFGTFVTDPLDGNGGDTYLYEVNDVTQLENTTLNPLNCNEWSDYGWHDMIDADIACDNSENTWEWGISSFVMSTTYGSGYTNGPTIVYSDEEQQGSYWISWDYYDGCAHTDVDIDPITHMGYCVYDWYDTVSGYWKLLVRKIDFKWIENGFDQIYEVSGTGNLFKPAIAVYNDEIVIVAETNVSGNKDIVCLHATSGNIQNLVESNVANGGSNEQDPDVRVDVDNNFIATYVEGNNLYSLKSVDAGVTWNGFPKKQINKNVNKVIAEYKTSDLCEFAVKAMWEETGNEIWIGYAIPEPKVCCEGSLIWEKVKGNTTVNGTFQVCNCGEENSLLNWQVDTTTLPNWSTSWVFTPSSGTDLGYLDCVTVKVEVVAPPVKKKTFTGKIKIINSDNIYDFCEIDVSLKTPRATNGFNILQWILEKYSNMFPIIRQILAFEI